MLTIYGIRNCDSCRKARKYFSEHDVDFHFHDVRKDGLDIEMLRRWSQRVEWTKLLNRKSLTWRKIPESEKQEIDSDQAIVLILKNPTLLKRPLLVSGTSVAVGLSEWLSMKPR